MNRRGDWRFLVHNLLHPLAGVAWFVGWASLGDWLHSIGEPPALLPLREAGPWETKGLAWLFGSHRGSKP